MGFLEIILRFFRYLVDLLMVCFLNAFSRRDVGDKERHRDHDHDHDQTPRASSSSSTPSRQNYEVFLSFSGKDTRRTFTSHLYDKLVDRGIMAFRDSEELRVGEKITQLFEAIKASEISIPIISPNYASSIWCLEELLQILECRETSGQLVLPIFYNVKPSDVRERKGDFGKMFHRCKREYGKLVPELEKAFLEVASLKGLELEKFVYGDEAESVKRVVARIIKELRKATLKTPDFLVGVEDHVENIKKMIDESPSDKPKIIVIHGMGGIGKTTLAKFLYNGLCDNFEHHSFVSNIREVSKTNGIEVLQNQMFTAIVGGESLLTTSHVDERENIIRKSFKGKRLLLFLDDVEDKNQLNKLLGKEDLSGTDSIVIITTRNKDVASVENLSYELNELNDDRSYELFCKHAFGEDVSRERALETIARDIVSRTAGLPLAIEVVGSYLSQEDDEDIWKETLEKLRRPDKKVQDSLKISYDSLDHGQKQIFLDIACLSINRELGEAICMWESCKFHPRGGIRKLISLSLIKVIGSDGETWSGRGPLPSWSRRYRNKIIMHDLLRDLGRGIVQNEADNDIGLRNRIWLKEEAKEVLQRKQGTPKVQALIFTPPCFYEPYTPCTSQHFEGMTNLRFLQMENVPLTGDFENHLGNLRWLKWLCAPDRSLKSDIMGINFSPKKLVSLHLDYSNITEHWKGWSEMKCLKVLELRFCRLTTTPDFSAWKLEVLVLVSCWKLRKIHPSIGKLSKTLKVLEVSCCWPLEELPIEVGRMEELRTLTIVGLKISKIPIFEGYMKKLETLYVKQCGKLNYIPDSLGSLVKLKRFVLTKCRSLTKIPDSIGGLCELESVDIEFTPIKCLPTSIGKLSKLPGLDLGCCEELESLPSLPSSLTSLEFNGKSMDTLPDFSNLTNLNKLIYSDLFERRNRALNLQNLNQLETLVIRSDGFRPNWRFCSLWRFLYPWRSHSEEEFEIHTAPGTFSLQLELPISLVELYIFGCKTLHTLPNLSMLKNLSKLRLDECSELMEINGLEGAESLTDLEIEGCRKLSRLGDLSHLKVLRMLQLSKCSGLVEINGLEGAESLTDLVIERCEKLLGLGDLSHLKMLRTLRLCDYEKLSDVQGIEKLTSLTNLCLSRCHPEINFPNLSMLTNLEHLEIIYQGLMEILGLEGLKSLKYLDVSGCESLQNLPDLSIFTNLKELYVCDCKNLIELQGFENLTSLWILRIRGCSALKKLPDLPNVIIQADPIEEEEESETDSDT